MSFSEGVAVEWKRTFVPPLVFPDHRRRRAGSEVFAQPDTVFNGVYNSEWESPTPLQGDAAAAVAELERKRVLTAAFSGGVS